MVNKETLSRALSGSIALAALTIGGVGLSATAASAAPRSAWDSIARCESGGDWHIDTGNGYYGGLQFSASTWSAYGGRGSAADSSKAAQITVARRVVASQGWNAWGGCAADLGLSGHSGGTAFTTAGHRTTHAKAKHRAAPHTHSKTAVHHATAKTAVHHAGSKAAAHRATTAVAVHHAAGTAAVHHAAAKTAAHHTAARHVAHHTARHAAAHAAGSRTYTVQGGDTLQGIATHQHVKGGWQALADASRLAHPGEIFPGQVLRLP